MDLPKNVWRSIFRNPLPSSDLGRSQTTFSNLFLHIHPVKTHAHSLKPWYTLGLGRHLAQPLRGPDRDRASC